LMLVRERDGRTLWSAGTTGPAGVCLLEPNGELVIADPDRPLWSSGTSRQPGSRLVLQDDGNAVLYSAAGLPVWTTNTTQPAWPSGPLAGGSRMRSGEVLEPGTQLESESRRYRLAYGEDGDLVLRRTADGGVLWSSGTAGRAGICVLQADGNLVLYDADVEPVWAANTWAHPGSTVTLAEDGALSIRTADGTVVWATAPDPSPLPGSESAAPTPEQMAAELAALRQQNAALLSAFRLFSAEFERAERLRDGQLAVR
ncbi:MAG: hypothetical protein ACLGIF_03605, partial [Actinomycetes bacterium]